MKVIIFLLILCSSLCANELDEVYEEWKKMANSEESRKIFILLLKEKYPIPKERVASSIKWALKNRNYEKAMLLKAVWHDLAEPEFRAFALSQAIAKNTEKDLFLPLSGYLKQDLLQEDLIPKELNFSRHSCRNEAFLNSSSYASTDVEMSSALIAMIYSLAPASAVLDFSELGENIAIKKLIDDIQKLRFEADQRNLRTPVIWDNIETKLLEALEYQLPELDSYVARVFSWAKEINPRFGVNSTISEILANKDNGLVDFLLNSNDPKNLVSIKDISLKLGKTKRDNFENTINTEKIKDAKKLDEKVLKQKVPSEENQIILPWWLLGIGIFVVVLGFMVLKGKSK